MNERACIICCNDIGDNSFITDLPDCRHMYHYNCISEWFKVNSTCPICKTNYLNRFNDIPPPQNNQNIVNDDIIDVERIV